MSDGGNEESKRGKESSITRPSEDNFGRAISRIAVAQICENIGFQSFNESALDSLAELAIHYLHDLGKAANFYSNLSGRTECNVFDVIQGLEDLCMSSGFSGASEVGVNCLMSSGVIKEIREYVELTEEIPFAQPVPHFPVIRELRMIPSFLQMGETPGFKHIPEWLPAFPDPHTYVSSAMWNERVSDPRTDQIELARQHRKAERSLLSLQQRLVENGLAVASSSAEPGDGRNGLEVNDIKKHPLEAGEQDVSPVVLPAKLSGEAYVEKHASLLETFAPAIEAMKDGLSDSGNGEKRYSGKKPAVRFEFKGGKKVFGESIDLRIRNKIVGRTASWFGREDEKDDKKRRVEFILRQSMENQQELT